MVKGAMSLSALSLGVIDFAVTLALSKLRVHFALPITARNTWHRFQAGVCCELCWFCSPQKGCCPQRSIMAELQK